MNCEDEWVDNIRRSLSCGISKLPINYLGIPLGANPRKAQTWKPIIDKVERRLALWKARSLSKAGRLILIKSVLNNLPTYYLSLFRIPKKVARRITQLQRSFFWGKDDGEKGGNLIAWDIIQKPRRQGGLGVGDLLTRNAALLFKWWWRFADDQMPLWKKIIESNHGVYHFRDLQEIRGNSRKSPWGQITDFSSFNMEIQQVANKGVQVKVGNGAKTKFWLDIWIGKDNLKSLFPRLFKLSNQKESHIQQMGYWENGKWNWALEWRRNLLAREEELLGDLYNAVNHITLRENTSDVREWSGDRTCLFSVANFVLQVTKIEGKDNEIDTGAKLAWRNIAPPRAQLQVWFMLHGRLNTKARLFRLRAKGVEDDRCVMCKEKAETIEHLFLECKNTSNLWYYCCDRWNISTCLPKEPKACLESWLGAPFKRFDKLLWTSMFYVIAWTIWDIRNKVAFHDLEPNWELEKKRLLWRLGWWMKGWCPNAPISTGTLSEKLNDRRG